MKKTNLFCFLDLFNSKKITVDTRYIQLFILADSIKFSEWLSRIYYNVLTQTSTFRRIRLFSSNISILSSFSL